MLEITGSVVDDESIRKLSNNIGTYEQGTNMVTSINVAAMSEILNVTTDYLLGMTDDKHSASLDAERYTGLSAQALHKLNTIYQIDKLFGKDQRVSVNFLDHDIISSVILDPWFRSFIAGIRNLKEFANSASKIVPSRHYAGLAETEDIEHQRESRRRQVNKVVNDLYGAAVIVQGAEAIEWKLERHINGVRQMLDRLCGISETETALLNSEDRWIDILESQEKGGAENGKKSK